MRPRRPRRSRSSARARSPRRPPRRPRIRQGIDMLDVKEAIAILKEKFGDRILDSVDAPIATTKEKPGVIDPFVRIAPKDLIEVMTLCRDEPRLRFDLLNCLT